MKLTHQDIDKIINLFNLEPLEIEGGHYALTYRSKETVPAEYLGENYRNSRCLSSTIYFLLTDDPDSFSAFHLLKSDEIYHFYLGDPVNIYLFYPDGTMKQHTLGQDIFNGQEVQLLVPKGTWQGSKLIKGGTLALMGTTVTPGFEHADFTLGNRQELCMMYPQATQIINLLTRG